MCPHPTNPPREPQPHPLSEWPPSQETAKPPPTTHPKRQPHDQPTPRRQRDRAGASLGGEPTTPSRTARKPHPPQSLLSARRLGPAKPKPSHPPSKPHHQKKHTDCLKKEPPEQRTLGQPLSHPTPQAHRMNSPHSALNKTNATMTAWLPLEIPSIPVRRTPRRSRNVRPCGRERAAWWFDQMRRIVETGADFCA